MASYIITLFFKGKRNRIKGNGLFFHDAKTLRANLQNIDNKKKLFWESII